MLRRPTAAHLNTDKCIFIVTNIVVLGHVISADGVQADPEKVAAITNLVKFVPTEKYTGSQIVSEGEPTE